MRSDPRAALNPALKGVAMGWKTYAGAALIGIGHVVALFEPQIGQIINGVGEALFGIGIGHKFVKLTAAANKGGVQ